MSEEAHPTTDHLATFLKAEPPDTEPPLFLDGGPLGEPGQLGQSEKRWLKILDWLQGLGYTFRARYQPDWVPSWLASGKIFIDCEDGRIAGPLMDATRASDGSFVALKWIDRHYSPFEPEISRFLSKPSLRDDPKNYCVPIFDVLQVPSNPATEAIIVVPLLKRVNEPRFETFGEIVAFFTQMFEVRPVVHPRGGIQFMHKHGVAHRDCTFNNIMMDATPMYPRPWHPTNPERRRDWKGRAHHYSRTQRPVKYYWIDFGHSRRYNLADGPPLERPQPGGDYMAPEHAEELLDTPCDPFPTDIYYLGNLVRTHYIKKYAGLNFMDKLVADMVQKDPSKRPTIDEVVARFADIRHALSPWKLRSRLIYK
ncbi:hypothetical protein OF83DRAFT_1069524, partial [Amylostereum chailletii]